MESEKEWFDRTRMRLAAMASRMFRNNVGRLKTPTKDGREAWVKFGLHTGSSDLIGWTSVRVTEEMVGCTVAVFTSLEGKRGEDVLSQEQYQWIQAVAASGGIAGVFTTDESAEMLVREVVKIIQSGGTSGQRIEQSIH